MSLRQIRRRTLNAIFVCTLLLGGACVGPFNRGSTLTYDEARDRLVQLIDGGLRAGLNGAELTQEAVDWDEICTDSNLAPIGDSYPTYTYHFPLEELGPNPEPFVDRVAAYWKSQGLTLDPNDADDEITGMFATSGDGFNLQTFVNRRTGMALVAGSGPCTDKPPTGFEEEIQ
jgi:hypothetical protein